ncbi:hypothetical protein Ocin01_15221 [Orchesella cincta]|uniref:Chitin-binding type-2 domain-containing protein n=1 Tax=Orchesella cincta TaxID=48709 RepID=A0A1D2MF24_ORCCI|nr:hypothetical protein Ocin01_15221 [Orchesella cincta]
MINEVANGQNSELFSLIMTRSRSTMPTKKMTNNNFIEVSYCATSGINQTSVDPKINIENYCSSELISDSYPLPQRGVKSYIEKIFPLQKFFRDKIVKESCHTRTIVDNGDEIITGSPHRNKRQSNSYSRMRASKDVWKYHYHQIANINLLRTFIISVIVFLNCCTTLVHCQPPPLPPAGFLDFDNLPVTRFSCEGKVIGGYYADVETGCQMFHVCTLGQKDEIQDIKFLCLNGTVFDQETRVCERVDEVDCSKAEQFFDLNLDLYVPHATTQKPEEVADLEEEDDNIRPVATPKPKVTTTTTTTTKPTTTTPKTTPSPRTRPPSTSSNSRGPPVVSSSSQEEDEEGDNNGYTSFNYFLKTPHSHVASGYNSQSRQSYIINQPGPSSGRSTSSSSSGTSSGRKVPSGQKTIVYTSSSTSSSTVRPKTVVVVKATLPQAKSTVKSKPAQQPTTTSQPKFELNDQYDEYYDEEDYSEQPSAPAAPPPKQSTFQSQRGGIHGQYASNSKPSSVSSSSSSEYDFRDGRSTKGEANAGSIIGKGSESKSRQVSVPISSPTPKRLSPQPTTTTTISSPEINGNNSTEEPYYYEDDYPDDVVIQQQQLQNSQFRPSGSVKATSGSVSSGRESTITATTNASSKPSSGQIKESNKQDLPSSSQTDSDYYDDDNENVNAHDHHFTHVDVPRIPFAKPNVPRVLVTNGKPFLPRLRRQSLHNHYSYNPLQYHPSDLLLPALPSGSSTKSYQSQPNHQRGSNISSTEFRSEARAKAMKWGRDYFR